MTETHPSPALFLFRFESSFSFVFSCSPRAVWEKIIWNSNSRSAQSLIQSETVKVNDLIIHVEQWSCFTAAMITRLSFTVHPVQSLTPQRALPVSCSNLPRHDSTNITCPSLILLMIGSPYRWGSLGGGTSLSPAFSLFRSETSFCFFFSCSSRAVCRKITS